MYTNGQQIIQEIQKIGKTQIKRGTTLYNEILDLTKNIIGQHITIKERAWYILNNTVTPPNCRMCDNPTHWDKQKQDWFIYCSPECTKLDKQNQIKNGIEPILKNMDAIIH